MAGEEELVVKFPFGVLVGGFIMGASLGFFLGYRYNREKIRAEVLEQAEKEIEEMREFYMAKTVAGAPKPKVEEIVEELGYSTPVAENVRPLKPPVPVNEPYVRVESAAGIFDYNVEIASRTPEEPYVIHENERQELDGYSSTSYTYYSVDDVLCEDVEGTDTPLPHADLIVGQTNLKFGHGSDDPNIVFVRNERLKLEMEIIQVDLSYEAEVLGLDPNDPNNS